MATAAPESILLPDSIRSFLSGVEDSIVIDGARCPSASGELIPVYDPATGRMIAEAAAGGSEEVDAAVRSARRVFDEEWRHRSPLARGRALMALADLIEANAEELAILESLDNGKPLAESASFDVPFSAEMYRYYGGWANKMSGELLPASPTVGSALAYTRREPFGVAGAIVPWNFPFLLTTAKVAPALAAGNCVVLKPAEQTPLTSVRLAELALEAGLPPGVLNVVTGYGTCGADLIAHPLVGTVSFTGSTATGRKVMQAAASGPKPVHLELGGKSPNIIFNDADLDLAVQGAFLGVFFNQGQVCFAGTRLFVHEDVFESVVTELVGLAREIRLGHGLAPGTEMGPLVSDLQLERVSGYVDRGRSAGAKILCGGERATDVDAGGYFYRPTVIVDVSDNMEIAREEVFGPVVVAMPFRDEEEVIARSNASGYGLAAGVWSKDISRGHRVAAALEAGIVWVNSYGMVDTTTPFGGFKHSGFGRDGGAEALHQYTQVKTVWVQLD